MLLYKNIFQEFKTIINYLKRNSFLLAENRNSLNKVKSTQTEIKTELKQNQTILRENQQLLVKMTKRSDEAAADIKEIKSLIIELELIWRKSQTKSVSNVEIQLE